MMTRLLLSPDRLSAALPAALASAALLALAMPGRVGWWPLLFFALVPLLFVALYQRPGRSALAGFVFGLVYHLALLYWILIVLGRYGGLPVWLSVPALILLALYLACYPAVFCLLLTLVAGRFWNRERSVAPLVWAAPVLWTGLDYLRGLLLTGFPWMDIGYGLYGQPRLIQAADLGGHFLITFGVVLTNSLLLGMIDRQRRAVRWNIRRERWLLLGAVGLLVFLGGYSLVRYQVVDTIVNRSMRAKVAVIQGNIDQAIKWSPDAKTKTVDDYIRLSLQALEEGDVELVVWPETALPFYLEEDPLIHRVFDFSSQQNTLLLTGVPFYQKSSTGEGEASFRFYNGAALIGPGGRLAGLYAKQHLVPFGEYVPLRGALPFLQPLVVNIDDFSAGSTPEPLVEGVLKLGVLICYESIFPDIARESVRLGGNLLVNITNDAWYGRSSAPWQSMAMTVFRAVENKRALVRSANTGISGLVDPLGRVGRQTDLFVPAFGVGAVPLLDIPTVFGRNGHQFGMFCALFIPLVLLGRSRERA
ncbi:MAG: apolipoprotein N-acyltransferase [Desulfobulbus sp.]|jgi:apolipoprotein N-acyltransferase